MMRWDLELRILLYRLGRGSFWRPLLSCTDTLWREIYAVMCLACNQQLPQLRGLISIKRMSLGENEHSFLFFSFTHIPLCFTQTMVSTTTSIQDNAQSDLSQIPSRRRGSSSLAAPKAKVLRPFNTSEIKVLLLENISHVATQAFQEAGYQVCHQGNVYDMYAYTI